MDRRTVRLPAIAAIALLAALLGACGSDGPATGLLADTTIEGGLAPAATDAPSAPEAAPATDAPAVPEAPEAPVVTEAPAVPDPNPITPDTEDSTDLVAVFLIVGGILLAAVLIGAVVSRSKKSSSTSATAGGSPTASAQSSLLSTSQWITDQLTLELMAAPPATAQQRWTIERTRLDNVAIGAQQQYLEGKGANWQPLGQTMSALAAAIDTNLALRAQDPPNVQLINESTDVVNRHRSSIQQLTAALRTTIDR